MNLPPSLRKALWTTLYILTALLTGLFCFRAKNTATSPSYTPTPPAYSPYSNHRF